jgi:AraC family ethanolamine operon transcriptional activator
MATARFQDFDEYAESVRDVDARMLIIRKPRRPSWSISQVEVGSVHVQLGREGSGNITEGWTRPDGYVLFMPLNHAGAHSVNGIPLDDVSVGILGPGRGFCVTGRVEHDWLSVFIPTSELDGCFVPEEASSDSERTACQVARLDRRLANRVRTSVREIMDVAANYEQFESSLASTAAGAGLRKLTDEILGTPPASEPDRAGRSKLPRGDIIRRSLELLEEQSSERIVVADLALAAGVSERTLRTAFQERYGVGPTRYLQLRHLHQVARVLHAADPEEETVSSVLLRHGEWEFGRFAGRYKQLFGELPSETLSLK